MASGLIVYFLAREIQTSVYTSVSLIEIHVFMYYIEQMQYD